MNDPIKVKKDGPILEVTIDRPKANAIDSKTSIILGDIFFFNPHSSLIIPSSFELYFFLSKVL